jgi:AcrR family transcriptional regulator
MTTTGQKQYHHGNLHAAVLAEAEAMLAESGVEGLSLREVARRAGVSHGAPRRHFPDKQALLSALVEHGYGRLGAQVEAAMADASGTFAQRLTAFAQVYVDFAVRNGELMTLMLTAKNWPNSERLVRANDEAFAPAVELLRQAAASGDIAVEGADACNMAVLAMLQGLSVLAGRGLAGTKPTSELVAGTIRTLVDGMRPR